MKTRQSWTIDGVLFILVTVAVGFAAYNTGASLLYLVLAMLLAFLVVSGVMASYMLRALEVEREYVGAVFAKRPTPIAVKLTNRKQVFASYSLVLRDEVASGSSDGSRGGSAFVYALQPGEEASLRYHVTFPRRGWEELSNIVLESRYPFGFFRRSLRLPMSRRLLVFPELYSLHLEQWRAVGRPGMQGGEERGEGTELHSLRDYTTRDSARRIVWKVSARVNKLIVAETLRDADPVYRLALNSRVANPADPIAVEHFERAVSFIASLGVTITPRGQRLVLYTPEGEVTVNERGDLERLLRAMALLPLGKADPAAEQAGKRWTPPDALQLSFANEKRVTRHAVEFADWSRLMHPLNEDGSPVAAPTTTKSSDSAATSSTPGGTIAATA